MWCNFAGLPLVVFGAACLVLVFVACDVGCVALTRLLLLACPQCGLLAKHDPLINQPINQPTTHPSQPTPSHQPTNRHPTSSTRTGGCAPTNQPSTNQPIVQPFTNQPIVQPSTNCPTKQPAVHQATNCPTIHQATKTPTSRQPTSQCRTGGRTLAATTTAWIS